MTFNGPIGDLIKFSIGGGWGSDAERSGYSEVAIIRGTDIPKVAMGDVSTVPRRFESSKKLINRLLKSGDIVLETAGGSSAKGQFTGRTLLVSDDMLQSLGPTICASFCKRLELNTALVEPGYFYWYMQDLYNSGRVAVYDSQSTGISNFQFSSFLESEFLNLPDLATQRAIAISLSSVNSLIKSNLETAQLLEEIAQTIFKSWFIDFDPVKAKMAGEKPVGMDDATAALFPDLMQDSELGPIPKGWKLSQIGDEVECVGGSTPSTSNSEFWDGDICWTTPKDLSKQIGLITTTSERRITSKGLEKISSGILPVNSVLMSSRAPIGYLSVNAVPSAINQGFIALRQNPRFASLYLLFWLQTNMAEIKNRAGGGTFAEISKSAFKSIPFVVPDEGILKKYDEVSEPILLQLVALTFQNQKLVELRDSLLPRLISGERQIPEEMLVS